MDFCFTYIPNLHYCLFIPRSSQGGTLIKMFIAQYISEFKFKPSPDKGLAGKQTHNLRLKNWFLKSCWKCEFYKETSHPVLIKWERKKSLGHTKYKLGFRCNRSKPRIACACILNKLSLTSILSFSLWALAWFVG